ncbi:uncharacterized protein LOC144578662 isoform X5 [Callithrix jacchus]
MGDGGVVSRSMEVYSQEDYDCLCCVMQVVRKVKENQQLQASPSSYAKGVSYETIQKGWLKTPGSPSLVSGRQTFLRSESSLAFRSSPEITRCQSAILDDKGTLGKKAALGPATQLGEVRRLEFKSPYLSFGQDTNSQNPNL